MFKKTLGAACVTALLASTAVVPAEASTRRIVKSGVIGAAGGALVGAVVPGISVGTGALVGGAGGAAIGALHKKKHRDQYGRSYYRDSQGRRHYNN